MVAHVASIWPPGAEVVVVSEWAFGDELAAGRPFVGRVGHTLRQILLTGGLDMDSVALTHVVRRAPDGGYDAEHFGKTFYRRDLVGGHKGLSPSEELVNWRAALARDLGRKRLRLVIACGNEALKATTGLDGIDNYSGSLLPCSAAPGLWVLPIIHPERIARGARWVELFVSGQMVRAKALPLLAGRWAGYVPWGESFAPEIREVDQFLSHAAEAENAEVALDIETRGGSIACVGLGYHSHAGTDHAMCIPVQTTRGPWFGSLDDEVRWWRGLQWLSERVTLIGHNMVFDLDWLYDYDLRPKACVDTMLAFHRQHPELPKSLDFVSMWCTDIPYYKSDGKTWGHAQPDEKLWSYNLKDVVATLRCWRHLNRLDTKAKDVYQGYTRDTWPLAFEMQLRGMPIDPSGVAVAREVAATELVRIRARLGTVSGGDLAVFPGNKKVTDAQVKRYLYGKLGLPPKTHRKTKAVTADEDAIVELLIEHPKLEELKLIVAERKFAKALNSYINIPFGPETEEATCLEAEPNSDPILP